MRPAFVNHHQRPSVPNFKLVVDPNLVGGSAPYYSFGGDVDNGHVHGDPRGPVNIPREEVDLPVPRFDDSSANRISVVSSNRGATMAQDSINTFLDDYYEVFQKNMKERVSKCEPANLIYVNTCDVTQPPPTHRPDVRGVNYNVHPLDRRTKYTHFPPNCEGEFSGLRHNLDNSYANPTPSFNPRVPPPMFHRPNQVTGENIRLPPLHIPPPPIPVQPPLPHVLQPPLPPSPPPQPPPLPPSDKPDRVEFTSAQKSRKKLDVVDNSVSSRHNVFSPPSTSGRRSRQSESTPGCTVESEHSKLDLDSRIKLLLNDGPFGQLLPNQKSSSGSRKHSRKREAKPSPPSSHNTPLFEEHPDEPLSPPPSPFRSRAIYLKWHSLWVQRTLSTKNNFIERTSESNPQKLKTHTIKVDKSSIGKKNYDVKKKLKQVLQQQKTEVRWRETTQKIMESPQAPDSTVDCAGNDVANTCVQEAMVCDSSGSPAAAGTDGVVTTVQSVVHSVVGQLTKDLKQELSNKLIDYMFGRVIDNWGLINTRGLPT